MMKYRALGRTGRQVSVVGLGTWAFGGEWGHAFTQAEVDAILDRAAEHGVNLLDTAECYGDHLAERLVGDYLRRRDRSRWFIATKIGHRFLGFMRREDRFGAGDAGEQLEASLRALGTDHVDLYQFHSGDDARFDQAELWERLRALRAQGKVRHLGVSILGRGSEHQARHAAARGAEVLQVIYNRLDRRSEDYAFPHARTHGLGVLARVPLASGLLSGTIRRHADFPPDDVRATFDAADWDRKAAEARRVLAEEIPPGTSPAAWALAWCLQRPEVSAVIPGAKSPEQAEANARAAALAAN